MKKMAFVFMTLSAWGKNETVVKQAAIGPTKWIMFFSLSYKIRIMIFLGNRFFDACF